MSHPVLPDFSNTAIAYASKDKHALNRAYWLFKAMNSATLVNVGAKLTHWALAMKLPIQGIIKATIYKQFCGGESISACESTIDALHQFKVGTILDYSVEGMADEKAFDACADEIVRTIHKANGDKRIPFAVFKLTGVIRFGLLEKKSTNEKLTAEEEQEWQKASGRVMRICSEAAKIGQMLFIDAEESWIQPAIDELTEAMMQEFNQNQAVVFNTIQLYRHDRLQYLKDAYSRAEKGGFYLGLKLVRGAYMEKERARAQKMSYPSPIQPDKAASDRDYNDALKFCVARIERIALCAGTHNEDSCRLLASLMAEHHVSQNHPHIWFSQLLGMSDNLSFNLSNAGYNVAKYVPYGPVEAVLPYLIRRAQENTSIAGQMSRELGLILAERKRRQKA